jgi:phage terminase small subunit
MAHAQRPAHAPVDEHTPLTPREERFAREYAATTHGTRSAIAAGFAPSGASRNASRLLRLPHIERAIRLFQNELCEDARVSTVETLRAAARIAFADVGVLFTPDGSLRHLRDLGPEARFAVQSFEVVTKDIPQHRAPALLQHTIKVKFHDKVKAIEILMRHLGLLQEGMSTAPTVPAFALPPETPGVKVH